MHDQLVIQCDIGDQEVSAEDLCIAMNGAFQDILRYKVTSDESRGYSFAEL